MIKVYNNYSKTDFTLMSLCYSVSKHFCRNIITCREMKARKVHKSVESQSELDAISKTFKEKVSNAPGIQMRLDAAGCVPSSKELQI